MTIAEKIARAKADYDEVYSSAYEKGKSEGGGSGGGVIDVAELPTENIDENAVYKIMGEERVEMYLVGNEEGMLAVKSTDFLASLGLNAIEKLYCVDTLPDIMEPTDLESFSAFHVYIINSTGVGYVSADGTSTSAMTYGSAFEFPDKGWTEDIASITGSEENMGVYAVTAPAKTTYGISTDTNTVILGYNGSVWDEWTVKETSLASANFTDYCALEGSADGITLTMTLALLTCLKIQSNVTAIAPWAFTGQALLKTVIIPVSVTSIGEGAFNSCSSLTSITYTGTKEQWKAITIDSNWDADIDDYTIYCTDGTIAKDGTET